MLLSEECLIHARIVNKVFVPCTVREYQIRVISRVVFILIPPTVCNIICILFGKVLAQENKNKNTAFILSILDLFYSITGVFILEQFCCSRMKMISG